MNDMYYLGLDQSTAGTTAILFDQNWKEAGRGYHEIPLYYPQTGWVEHDAREVWTSILLATLQALSSTGAGPESIICVGLNHEGESVVVWDRGTGQPIYNSIVWQDRRTAREADQLADRYNDLVHSKTGLMVDSYFSATKIKWILDHVEGARDLMKQGRLLCGTLDSWIVWKMTHGRVHVTDASTASRTLLFNIHTGQWDEELLELFDIDRSILPEIRDSATQYAFTDPLDFLGARVPISSILVDQQAAMVGQACITPGTIKTTYGTGCFMLMNTGDKAVASRNGLLPTVAWKLGDQMTFALDGGVYSTGAATKWLKDGLGILASTAESEKYALEVENNGGVYFVPAFTGLAAPHWDSYASGMMIGINGGTGRAHIIRATLESTAYQVRDVLDVMQKEANVPISVIRCNGAATTNRFLMQFQADILNIPLDIPEVLETTALGAAFMAALGIGEFGSIRDVENIWKPACRYEPRMSADQRDYLLYHWHRAVERAKYWIED